MKTIVEVEEYDKSKTYEEGQYLCCCYSSIEKKLYWQVLYSKDNNFYFEETCVRPVTEFGVTVGKLGYLINLYGGNK